MEELETCKKCDHCEVCSLKRQFASCVQALEQCMVNTPNGETQFLKDFDFIKIDINCKHFSDKTKPIFR